MATEESIITIHVSKDIDSKTLEALGQMMKHVEKMVMSKEFDNFKELAKVIVKAPKQKKRKPKAKPKKPKKKGGK